MAEVITTPVEDKNVVVLDPKQEELAPLVWWKARSSWYGLFGILGALLYFATPVSHMFGWTFLDNVYFDPEQAATQMMSLVGLVGVWLERRNPARKITMTADAAPSEVK